MKSVFSEDKEKPNKKIMVDFSVQSVATELNDYKKAEGFIGAYDNHASGMFRYALFKVNNKELAEDLISQTFTQTWNYLQTKEEKIKYWKVFLYRTLNNLIVNHYRRKHLEPLSLDGIDESSNSGFIDEKYLPEKLNRKVELKLVLAALQELSAEQKDVLLWRYVDDLDIEEIAVLTGKKKSAVYVSIHRALQKLRAQRYK